MNMKKIGKDEWHRLESAASTMTDLKAKIAEIVAEANAKLEAVASEFEDARQDAYNVLDDACNEAQSYYDERSEKWQEGDAGSQYQDWISELESARDNLEETITLSLDEPDSDTIDGMINAIEAEIKQTPDA